MSDIRITLVAKFDFQPYLLITKSSLHDEISEFSHAESNISHELNYYELQKDERGIVQLV
jgi:hypothetical protein